MNTAENLNRIIKAKKDIRQAIQDKGVVVSNDLTLDKYAEKISEIPQEGGGGITISKVSLKDTGVKLGASTFREVPTEYFDFDGVYDMSLMFEHCHNLNNPDFSFLDFKKINNIKGMLYNCQGLKNIDVSGWDVSNIDDMSELFYNCQNLQSLDLSSWSLKENVHIGYMFDNCTGLRELDMSTWDYSKTQGNLYFGWHPELTNINFGYNYKGELGLYQCEVLSVDSLLSIFNGLYDFTGNGETPDEWESKVILSYPSNELLSDEQRAIATDKGWRIEVWE